MEMALKGNLLFNGDFETGTTEGWILGAFGYSGDHQFTACSEAKYRGEYGGRLYDEVGGSMSYLSYDKRCSFEEHEAYLFMLYLNMVSGYYSIIRLVGMDDKGNKLCEPILSYNDENNVWKRYLAILRGFGDVTHFQFGIQFLSFAVGDKLYLDEAKLIPLRSIRSHTLTEGRYFDGLTSNTEKYVGIACVGRCRLRSIVKVTDVSGTSPSLNVKIIASLIDNEDVYYELSHSEFTSEGFEEKVFDLPEAIYLKAKYEVGGTDPSFKFYHYLRIEPL